MGLFSFCPKIGGSVCCFCSSDLQQASFIIALEVMIFCVLNAVQLFLPLACTDMYDVSSPVQTLLDISRWVLLVLDVLVFISGFIFLIGIFTGRTVTADIFLCFLLLRIIVSIAHFIILLIQIFHMESCQWYLTILLQLVILDILLCSYFFLVVNSFVDEM